MNNLPRQTLRRIIEKYGREICGDGRRCESLLNDLCGSYRREINVLVNAIEERVPLDLLAAGSSMPLEALLKRLKKRLEEHTAMTAEAASWAVDSWALALNITTDAEIEALEKRAKQSTPISNVSDIRRKDSVSKDEAPISNQQKTAQTPVSVPQPKVNPPVLKHPAKTPLPPVFSPKANAPAIQTQTVNASVVPKRRFGFSCGCLAAIILVIISSIVLFFGVPYAIEVMREPQRQNNSEPPRFPVR